MTLLLHDADLADLAASDAVDWMLRALREHHAGVLTAPPRARAQLGDGAVVLTAGQGTDWFGYRVYDTLATSAGQQVVVAHDGASGDVLAVHVGNRLGQIRTGALGGAAMALLGPGGPCRLAVVGAGAQAWHQLWAATAVLPITGVRVTSRTPGSREVFAARAQRELALPTVAVDTVVEAVAGADVVVLATTSRRPVLDPNWLQDDVLVVTVGPKQVGGAEFGPELVTGATLVTTDSPTQLGAYQPPALVSVAGLAEQVLDLAHLAVGETTGPRTGRRVHLSVGLAGTEAFLLAQLARRMSGG